MKFEEALDSRDFQLIKEEREDFKEFLNMIEEDTILI